MSAQDARRGGGIFSRTIQLKAQPSERDVICNNDVRVSIIGQLPGAAAVAYSALFSASISSLRSWRLHSGNHDSHNEESSGKQARNREAIAPKCALCGPDP